MGMGTGTGTRTGTGKCCCRKGLSAGRSHTSTRSWLDHAAHDNEGLDVHGQEDHKSVDHYKFMPFSMGPHTCPGYSFAKVSLFLQAAAMMQCFEWKLRQVAHAR
jgi:hypothetical protein